MEARNSELSKLLAAAIRDIDYLHTRNTELERQLRAAAAWEPPVS
jgi:hypothetical protein